MPRRPRSSSPAHRWRATFTSPPEELEGDLRPLAIAAVEVAPAMWLDGFLLVPTDHDCGDVGVIAPIELSFTLDVVRQRLEAWLVREYRRWAAGEGDGDESRRARRGRSRRAGRRAEGEGGAGEPHPRFVHPAARGVQ